jgi:hypothetical protein
MQALKPCDEFAGAAAVQNGFCQDNVDWSLVLMADAPNLTSAGGFQDRVAKAAQDQGLR